MYLNELKTGMQLTTKSITVDKSRMLAFAEEFNPAPIHTDEDYAASTKFGQLLSPGMFSFLLVWAKYIEQDFFGDALIAGKSTKVEWDAPVFAGDTLTGRAEIIDIIPRNARNGIAVLALDVCNQNGDTVLRSVTEAVVRCSPNP